MLLRRVAAVLLTASSALLMVAAVVVMVAAGALGLFINPHGGLYGGTQHEVDVLLGTAGLSGLVCAGGGVGVGVGLVWSWRVFRRPAAGAAR